MPALLTLIGLGSHAYLGKAGAHEFKIRERERDSWLTALLPTGSEEAELGL